MNRRNVLKAIAALPLLFAKGRPEAVRGIKIKMPPEQTVESIWYVDLNGNHEKIDCRR